MTDVDRSIYTAYYRLNEFERMERDLLDLMIGAKERFLPVISDQNGRIDGGKLEKMMEDMIGAFNRYRDKMAGEDAITPELTEFYRAFLYCALTGPYLHDQTDFYIRDTYKEILNLARDRELQFDSVEDMVWYDQYSPSSVEEEKSSLIYFMNEAYRELTGSEPEDMYNAEEQAALEGLADLFEADDARCFENKGCKSVAKLREELRQQASEEDKSEMTAVVHVHTGDDIVPLRETEEPPQDKEPVLEEELWPEEMSEMTDKELEEYFYGDLYQLEMISARIQQSIDQWKAHLPEEHRVIEEYRRFRTLYFQVDHTRLSQDMETLITAYLIEQGISAFSMEENYGLVDRRLRKTAMLLELEVKRARALP